MILIYYKTWIYQCLIIQAKSPSTDMVSRPGLGSDPPFGSDRDSGCDIIDIRSLKNKLSFVNACHTADGSISRNAISINLCIKT